MLPVTPLFINVGPSELGLVVFLVLLFFGADKLPRFARALGRFQGRLRALQHDVMREADRERLAREFDERYGRGAVTGDEPGDERSAPKGPPP